MSNYTNLLQSVQALKATLENLTAINSNEQSSTIPTKRKNDFTEIERSVKQRSDNINEYNRKELWVTRFGELEFFGNTVDDYNGDPNEAKDANIFDSHCHLDRIFFGPTNEPGLYRNIGLGLPRSTYRDMGEKNNDNLPKFKPLEYLRTKFPESFGKKFEGCISVCCDPEYWEKEKMEWLMQEPDVWLTIGCHPSKAPLFTRNKELFLKQYLKHDKVVALGEIGLDESWYKRGGVTKNDQVKAFKAQIEIAVNYETQKPIVIHLRGDKSIEDAYNILGTSGLSRQRRIHMHCIGATKMEIIEKWAKEWPNMMFGVTNNYFLMEVGKELSLDRLLLETDSPYFVPKKFCEDLVGKPKHPGATGRSKKYPIANPGMVFHTAAQIARIRNISVDKVLVANRRNIQTCYDIANVSNTPCSNVDQTITREQTNMDVSFEKKVEWNDWSDEWRTDVLSEEAEIVKAKST